MALQKNILITICARGGSKGIPGKNIKLVGNRTLIDYSVQTAKKAAEYFSSKYNVVIALSTDHTDIINAAKVSGLTTDYRRPEHLGSDDAGKIDAIKDLVLFEENKLGTRFDYILDLDVTSPFRTLDDLVEAFEMIDKDSAAETLFSVSNAGRNPYFNMVEQKEDGYYGLVKQLASPFLTRQSSPKVYDINGSFYWYKRPFYDTGSKTPIMAKTLVYVMPHICFDLDHMIDFEFMDFLIKNDKLDFKF